MEQLRINEQFREPIHMRRLEQAFRTVEFARSTAEIIRRQLVDPQGYLLMHGSFVYGYCNNPHNANYQQPPDEERVSDLDLIIIDNYLFNQIPPSQRITREGVVPELARGKITYPFTYSDGKIREYLKVRNDRLYEILYVIQQTTGRRVDIKIIQDLGIWHLFKKKYWILSDRTQLQF